MIYLVGWGFLYKNFLLSAAHKHRKWVFVGITIVFLGGIAVLLGNVGNDTLMVYEPMVGFIQSGIFRWRGLEPLFMV